MNIAPRALYALLCLIWGSTWLAIKIGLVLIKQMDATRVSLSTLVIPLLARAPI